MTVVYEYSSARARKARFSRLVGNKQVLILLQFITAIFAAAGTLLVVTGYRAGAVLIGLSTIILLLLLWYYGELQILPARLPIGDQALNLDQALDQETLALLPNNPSVIDIWNTVKGNWQRHFFRVRFGLDSEYFEVELQQTTVTPEDIWTNALELAKSHQLSEITPGVITISLFLHTSRAEQKLNDLHLELDDLSQGLYWLKHIEISIEQAKSKEHYGGLGRDWDAGYTPLLNRLAHNISSDIQRGGLWIRDTETHTAVVDQMLRVLSTSKSSSVALVGELGVGKTTTVYAMAKKLLTEKVPNLRYHQIFNLDASTLIANTSDYQSLEQLLLGVFGEASRAGNIILFLDEAQLFMRAGTGSIDLTNVLLPVLQSGRLHIIFAMTPQEWQLLTTTNSALAGMLNYQVMPAPNRVDSLKVMEDQLLGIEHKHNVVFMHQAVQEAYRLAEKYVHEHAFPGRGIQVLEESAVFAGKGLITPEIIGACLEAKLGVKVVQATSAEKERLLNLEDELHKRLINQVRAVSVVANALRRARSGVNNPNRPVGTFLFLGPTGVGKTELSKALADVYFGGREHIIRVNLNEYNRGEDVTRLLATNSVESGGNSLPASIRRQPYSVVLLDEIEKAHPEVLNVLLQLLDEGSIRDTAGREASFKDAIVIATSNAGADTIREQVQAGRNLEEFEEEFTNQLIDKNLFKPEFLNRFDEIVLFRPLKPDELAQVVHLMIDEVNETLARQKVRVALSEAAISWLVQKGDDPRLGARPMRRMVQRSVENIVAKKILSGTAGPGSEIALDVVDLESAGQ